MNVTQMAYLKKVCKSVRFFADIGQKMLMRGGNGARIEEIRGYVSGLFFRPGPGSGIITRITSWASIIPTEILILPNPVPRMQESIGVYPVTTEIVPLVVGQTDCLLPEPILHAPRINPKQKVFPVTV